MANRGCTVTSIDGAKWRDVFGSLYPQGIDPSSFDEGQFLEVTTALDATPAERLRQLAIWCASEWPPENLAEWQRVDALYRRAAQHAPTAPEIFHSRGLSAQETWERTQAPADREQLFEISRAAYEAALGRAPNDPEVLISMGLLYYFADSPGTGTGDEWFFPALAADPQSSRARLYLAHTRQDRGDCKGALELYSQIDRDRLAKELQPWRVTKLDEQIATCHLRLGHREQALSLFRALVAAYERAPAGDLPDDLLGYPDDLVQAATTELATELNQRVRQLVARHGWDSYHSRYKPRLFED